MMGMKELKALLINPDLSIRKTLERMDGSGAGILFVVAKDNVLRGVVTDGDLRRWILKGKSLAEPISRAMHDNPVVLKAGHTSSEARDLMLLHRIECVPVVDGQKRVLSTVRWTDFFEKNKSDVKKENIPVIIMAGGEGQRLAPLTHILPKPLVPIGEKPIIDLIIDRFVAYGSHDFYLSLNYKSLIIKAYFQEKGQQKTHTLRYLEEKKPLGTAGSLGLPGAMMEKTFWVSNCDILIDADFSDVLRVHRKDKNAITLIGSIKHYTIPYGVCKLGTNGELDKINEKPEYDFLVNTGVYVIEPTVLRYIPKNKAFDFTDLINVALKKGEKIGVYPVSEKSWMDMGEIEELKKMSRQFGVNI